MFFDGVVAVVVASWGHCAHWSVPNDNNTRERNVRLSSHDGYHHQKCQRLDHGQRAEYHEKDAQTAASAPGLVRFEDHRDVDEHRERTARQQRRKALIRGRKTSRRRPRRCSGATGSREDHPPDDVVGEKGPEEEPQNHQGIRKHRPGRNCAVFVVFLPPQEMVQKQNANDWWTGGLTVAPDVLDEKTALPILLAFTVLGQLTESRSHGVRFGSLANTQ